MFCSYSQSDLKSNIKNHSFGCGMIDGTTGTAQLSQEAGLHRIFNLETFLPEEIVLGLSSLESENAEGVFTALKHMSLNFGLTWKTSETLLWVLRWMVQL